MTPQTYDPPAELSGVARKAWIVAAIGTIACAAGFVLDSTRFYQSYLVAWVFVAGIALGCLAFMMLHHLSGGAWGLMVRRIFEAATRSIPVLVVLFVPIVIGLQEIFVWARPEVVAEDPLIQQKAAYLNPTGFVLRAAAYFVIWIGLSMILNRMSKKQDEGGDERGLFFRRMQTVSGPGLGLFALAGTFASVDWMMSLDPHWYSSLYGVSYLAGQGIAGLSFVVLVALWLSSRAPMDDVFKPNHFHDYGKLILAFVMLWTYFALSQLLIIWSGNLPEEVTFYLERVEGNWKWLSIALALFHFALPFVLLLSRDLKRNVKKLARVAVLLLVVRWFDIYWQAAPGFHRHGLAFHWLDLATILAIGGVWVAVFARELGKRPLLPINDPFLAEAMTDE